MQYTYIHYKYIYIRNIHIYIYIYNTPINTVEYIFKYIYVQYVYIYKHNVCINVNTIEIRGSSKKTTILSNSLRRNLHAPFPPIQCCYFALLGNAFKKKQPFRFRCRHALGNNIDQGGAGGSGVMWQHVGGWLFFQESGIIYNNYTYM